MRSAVTQPLRLHWVHARLEVWGGLDVAAFLALPGEVVPEDRRAYERVWDTYLSVLYRADPAESVMLDGLLRQLLHPFMAVGLRQQPNVSERFTAVITYARSHLHEPLRLADLARQAGLEPTHFIRSFRAETGCTPMAWLRRCRVEAAIGDLAAGGATLGVLARRWGFHDAFHLSKAVKAVTGQAPSSLRKAANRT
jgi:AraC-like DNA-binding protein